MPSTQGGAIQLVVSIVLAALGLLLLATHLSVAVGVAVSAVDRGERLVIDTRTFSLFVREGTSRAFLFLFGVTGLGQAPPVAGPDDGSRRVPVILVAGYGHNRSSMRFLRAFLVHRGWRWVWPVNVATREAGLADMAIELGRRVAELKRVTGAPQVDVVGQSLGGLVAAWYVAHLDTERSVRRLVTLGTPWRGTKLAVFARSKVHEDVLYDSPALDGLAPPPVPTVSVWTLQDNVVIPAESAVPEGVASVCIDGLGHTEMLVSTRAFRAVQAALSHRPGTAAEPPVEAR